MTSKKILNFIYKLHRKNIKLWVEKNIIKIFVPNEIELHPDYSHFIKENKIQIIELLNFNKINSPEYSTVILSSSVKAPLSYAQERLWFIEQYEGGTNAYNIPILLKISNETNLEILELSLKKILSRHSILRTLIRKEDNLEYYQHILEENEIGFNLQKKIISKTDLQSSLEKEVNQIFLLEKDIPLRVSLFEIKEHQDLILSLIFHHIVFDGWSVEIFLRELNEYYFNLLHDQSFDLINLSFQYKDFALWQKNFLEEEFVKKQMSYWVEKLDSYEINT